MKTALNSLILLLLMTTSAHSAQVVLSGKSTHQRTYTDYCADANAVLCYRMNENAQGKVLDSSGNQNIGIESNVTYMASGKEGGAYTFNATTSYITIQPSTSINNVFDGGGTIAGWIDPNSFGEGNFGRIVATDDTATSDGSQILLNDTNNTLDLIQWNAESTPGFFEWSTPTNSIVVGSWIHFAVTYDSSSIATDPLIYLNGVSQTVTEDATASPAGTREDDSNGNKLIGNRSDNTRTFDGEIDEMIWLTRVLSADEILDIYTNGLK